MIPIKSKEKLLVLTTIILAGGLVLSSQLAEARPSEAFLGQTENTENTNTKGVNHQVKQLKKVEKIASHVANHTTKKITHFCDRVSTLKERFQQKMVNGKSKFLENYANRLNRWKGSQNNIDSKIANWRKQQDANLSQNFQLLEKKAQTSKQQTAVKNFQEMMLEAIQTRRIAVDKARNDFHQAIMQVVQQRKDDVEKVVEASISNEQDYLSQAQATCQENNVDENLIQNKLNSNLKLLKSQFLTNRKKIEGTKSQIKTLAQAHRQAIKTANNNFHLAVQKAVAYFKSAFPSNDTSSDSSSEEGVNEENNQTAQPKDTNSSENNDSQTTQPSKVINPESGDNNNQ